MMVKVNVNKLDYFDSSLLIANKNINNLEHIFFNAVITTNKAMTHKHL